MFRKKLYLLVLPILAGFIISLAVNAASGAPGSQANPVVSKSYAEDALQPLRDQLESLQFEVSRLKELASRDNPTKFIDVPSTYWAYNDIQFMIEKRIISGIGDGRFGPANPARRSELAVMLVKALNLPTAGVSAEFADVPKSHWAYVYIAAAQKAGIISGFPGGQFKPDQYVTRGQMAVMLARAYELEKTNTALYFKDVTTTYWAFEAIQKLADNNISSGYADKTFRPSNMVNRAEVAVFLAKAIDPTRRK